MGEANELLAQSLRGKESSYKKNWERIDAIDEKLDL